MMDSARPSVLRRMLKPPRRPQGAAPGVVEDCVALTFPRAADELVALSLEMRAMTTSHMDLANVLKSLSDHDLIFLMTTETGASGACVLNAGLVSGLTEVQLTGRVSSAPPAERRPTRTDAVVVSDMVDRWISAVQAGAVEGGFQEVLPLHGALRTETILDLRAAALTLDPGAYEMLRIVMSLDGAKEGVLTFFLPRKVGQGLSGSASWEAEKGAQLLDLPAVMDAVLARVHRPLSEVLNFEPGDCVLLPDDAMRSLSLEGERGVAVANARLGQLQGMRAVMVSTDRVAQAGHGAEDVAALPPRAPLALPDAPDPSAAATPDVSGAPAAPEPQDLPDLPDVSGLPDMPDLPDLPDLPEMPDLPDLPDLPPLETLPEP